MTADSLLGKAVSCAVSVVKVDRAQIEAGTNFVRGGKYFCGCPERPTLANRFVTFLLGCTFGKMILPPLKSTIPAGFCKLNRC